MFFIIKNNSAYIVKGKKAVKIKFNENMTYELADEEIENISKEKVYTLQEVIAKLNVKENLRKRLMNRASSNNNDAIIKLEKELADSKDIIEKLMKELSDKEQIILELQQELAKKDVKSTKEENTEQEKTEKENNK